MTAAAHLSTLRTNADRLLGQLQGVEASAAELDEDVKHLTSEVTVLTLTSRALEGLLNAVSTESLEEVERLVTFGLSTVFPDRGIGFKFLVESKRNQQWLTPQLVCDGVSAPILEAFGGGPASVVAFLLRLMVCKRLGLAPVVLLDESFSMVSSSYLEGVGQLLRQIAEKLGFLVVLVTHQRELVEFAHRKYEARETRQGTVFTEI